MFKLKRKIAKSKNPAPQTPIKKLSIIVSIVDRGHGDPLVRLYKRLGVSAQFIQRGEGTAHQEIRDILGMEDNQKDVVLTFIDRDKVDESLKEANAYFLASPANRGIAMSIPVSSLIGMRVYQFLTDSI